MLTSCLSCKEVKLLPTTFSNLKRNETPASNLPDARKQPASLNLGRSMPQPLRSKVGRMIYSTLDEVYNFRHSVESFSQCRSSFFFVVCSLLVPSAQPSQKISMATPRNNARHEFEVVTFTYSLLAYRNHTPLANYAPDDLLCGLFVSF